MKTCPASSISTTIIILVAFTSHSRSQNDKSYDDCSPFNCGNINFSFPFSSPLTSGRCGLPGYQITCDDPSSGPKFLLSGRLFQVKAFYPSDRLITVVDTELIQELTFNSCNSMYNLSINPLTLPEGSINLTFYKCPGVLNFSKELVDNIVVNSSCDGGGQLYLWVNRSQFERANWFNQLLTSSGCGSVLVHVSGVRYELTNGSMKLDDALGDGFPLTWPRLEECERCQNRSGRCGYDSSLKNMICFCKGGCEHNQWKWKPLIIGLSTGTCSLLLIVLLFRKRNISLCLKKSYSDPKPGDGLNVK